MTAFDKKVYEEVAHLLDGESSFCRGITYEFELGAWGILASLHVAAQCPKIRSAFPAFFSDEAVLFKVVQPVLFFEHDICSIQNRINKMFGREGTLPIVLDL